MAYHRGEITLKILEGLADFAGNLGDFIEAFLSSGYGAGMGFARRYLRAHHRDATPSPEEIERAELAKLRKIVFKLKSEGFISSSAKSERRGGWVTARGFMKMKLLKKRIEQRSLYPEITYEKAAGDKLVIVIFDIPEKRAALRYWLRSALHNLGLKKLQKSVWIGKVKIPEAFLNDIKHLRLLDAIEIFEVGKTGTLRHVV